LDPGDRASGFFCLDLFIRVSSGESFILGTMITVSIH